MSKTEKPKYWVLNSKTKTYEPPKMYQLLTDPENPGTKLVRKSVYDSISSDPNWIDFFTQHYVNSKWKIRVIDDKEYTKMNTTKRKTEKAVEKSPKNTTQKAEHTEKDKVSKYLDYLYPRLEDEEFNLKLSQHQEMYDNQYSGFIGDIREESEARCNEEFELMPHQNFVKNFMSYDTPYNSLLLYHGLGSGKTCSAIGISEEYRKYMKQLGQKKSIIIVASPNVQDNFKSQLFNEAKLEEKDGLWTMNTCVGKNLLQEVNPTTSESIRKNYIVKEIQKLISSSYSFMGYTQFANYIMNNTSVSIQGLSKTQQVKMRNKKMKALFSNRLIIIDEIHNLRMTRDNHESNLKSAEILMDMIKHSENVKLLLLSATPMYNSHEEIIWLTNIMNINDGKEQIKIGDVFSGQGDFKKGGRDLLVRKLTGYISYVRGENPYSFPVRIYAKHGDYFDYKYVEPKYQLNIKPMSEKIKYVPVFYNDIGEYQKQVYFLLMRNMNVLLKELYDTMQKEIRLFENMDSFGYTLLQRPLEMLNMVYPNKEFIDLEHGELDELPKVIKKMVGKSGLENVMRYDEERLETDEEEANIKVRTNFEYTSESYGRIFSEDELHKYSAKMANICKILKTTEGIILIYSQYIDGGVVPMALALEEMGFTRYSSHRNMKSLLKTPPSPIDYSSMKPKKEHEGVFHAAKYVMITGDKNYSRTNDADIKYLNHVDNVEGKNVKVVLISKAAAEGIDFKNIRQVHILDPWYNMNRIEQIIGRGVRNLSHCGLPFEKRNVEIFLHATNLENETEAADAYIYRIAEKKSVKIGKITRLLKENSVDCLLNIGQNNFTSELMMTVPGNESIEYRLPNGSKKAIALGDKPFTDICDYMENCSYTCRNERGDEQVLDTHKATYNDSFIITNNAVLTKKIRDMFMDIPGESRGKFFLTRDEIIRTLNAIKSYPLDQINYTLNNMVTNPNEFLLDKYGRIGRLVNKGVFYYFQPVEITSKNASVYEMETPVDVKLSSIKVELPMEFKDISHEANEVMTQLEIDFTDAFDKDSKKSSWYSHFNSIRNILEKYGISKLIQKRYVVFHFMDCLKTSSKIEVMNYIYNKSKLSPLELIVKDYFDEKIVISDKAHDIQGVILSEDGKTTTVFSMNEDGNYVKPTLVQTRDLLLSKTNMAKNVVNKEKLNDIIGFFEMKKGIDQHVMKLRDLRDTVNRVGSRVNNIEIKLLISKLNDILGKDKFTVESATKTFKSNKKDVKNKVIVFVEMILRFYQETKHNNKIWFFTDEQYVMNKMSKYKKN